jgi:hypothetical protein
LNPMGADYGFRRSILMEQPFTSNCRPAQEERLRQ